MLLENKVATIYGAGGSIGSAVAREGATVFLAGRTQASLDKVANEIQSNSGAAQAAILDALDEQAVNKYVTRLLSKWDRSISHLTSSRLVMCRNR